MFNVISCDSFTLKDGKLKMSRSELSFKMRLKAVLEDLWRRMAAELLAKEQLGRLKSFQVLLRHGRAECAPTAESSGRKNGWSRNSLVGEGREREKEGGRECLRRNRSRQTRRLPELRWPLALTV